MKIYFLNLHKITIEKLTDWHSTFSLIPFIKTKTYSELKKTNLNDLIYENIFHPLFLNGKNFNHVCVEDPAQADVFINPLKFNIEDIYPYLDLSKKLNIKIIGFLFDDDATPLNLPDNVIVYRSSLLKSLKHQNERILPYIAPDQKYCNILPEKAVGFCGRTQHGRLELLNDIKQSGCKTSFLIRDSYWNHWADNDTKLVDSRREFNKNLTDNMFHFCYRGHGNFSYRFYEILSFGRVPVLIDSDNLLPFENFIKWKDYIILLKKGDINKLPSIIESQTFDLDKIRKLWEDYFSPLGYFNSFLKDLCI
jgi:hypothetical protein